MDTPKVDPQLTTTIVKSYVGHHTVVAGQVPELITLVHRALGQLGTPLQPEEVHAPAVSVRQSVHHEYVVCLDCGFRGKTLRRHINAQHGLSPDKYLARWGLRRDHPLTAPAYSEQRSSLAKEHRFGRRSTAGVTPKARPVVAEAAMAASAETQTPAASRRRARSRSKQADFVNEAVAASRRARTGRPRSRPALR